MLIPLFLGLLANIWPSATPISCDCPQLPSRENLTEHQYDSILIRQAYDRADLVFFAEVTGFAESGDPLFQASADIQPWEVPSEKRFGIKPIVALHKVYKGPKKFLKKKNLHISQRWRLCDMYFNNYESYIFFGQLDKNGAIRTNICTPNRMIRSNRQLLVVESWLE